MYEASLCTGCSQPRDLAWHSATLGWWEHDPDADTVVCLACTARNDDEQVAYSLPPRFTMPPERRARDITPLTIGRNTIAPDRRAPSRDAPEKSIGG